MANYLKTPKTPNSPRKAQNRPHPNNSKSHLLTALLVIVVALLTLAACSVTPAGSPDGGALDNPFVVAATEGTSADVSAMTTGAPKVALTTDDAPAPTITDLAASYLRGDDLWSGYYEEVKKVGDGWIWVDSRVKFGSASFSRTIYPGATFPEETWTPEAVLQSYLDKTANWQLCTGVINRDVYYLWSQDYEYIFTIDDGWLEVNASPSVPFDCRSVPDITPQALLELYHSGEWDGEGKLWSKDYSTYVEKTDYVGLYYYFHDLNSCNNRNEYTYTKTGNVAFWDGLDDVQGFSVSLRSRDFESDCAYIDCRLDLPEGKVNEDELGKLIRLEEYRGEKSRAITETGVYYYLQGNLLDSWKLQMNPKTCYLAVEKPSKASSEETSYVYTGSQLLELLPHGETRVILDNCLSQTNYGNAFWAYYIENGSLKRWRNCDGEITTETIFHDGAVKVIGPRPLFVELDDGYTYVFTEGYGAYANDFKAGRLGTSGIDYYAAKWLDAEAAGNDNLQQFVISNNDGAYYAYAISVYDNDEPPTSGDDNGPASSGNDCGSADSDNHTDGGNASAAARVLSDYLTSGVPRVSVNPDQLPVGSIPVYNYNPVA